MHILELDYETTGLEPRVHCLLEVGARVFAPGSLEPLSEFHSLVAPAIGAAAAASSQAMAMHKESKLFERALAHKQAARDVEKDMIAWLEPFERPLVLGGNTSHFDRGFMDVHMPRLSRMLSHRHADVSGMRMCLWWLTGKDPMTGFEKTRQHTALADLDETENELAHYKQQLGL